MTPAEARSIVLRHLHAMADPATVTAEEMHAVEPGMTVPEWGHLLWGMGRITDQGRLLHAVRGLDVRGHQTCWALSPQGWAAARRLAGATS